MGLLSHTGDQEEPRGQEQPAGLAEVLKAMVQPRGHRLVCLEGHGPITKWGCSSWPSQGYEPGLTHVGVVEAPRHEAPLCPVPPRTRGVTTIAPVERGRSLSSSHAEEAEVDPLKPQGKKEPRAATSPNPNAVGPPRKVPAQLLPPNSHTAQRPNSQPCSQRLKKPQVKYFCQKTRLWGYWKTLPLASYWWRQDTAQRGLQAMQSPPCSHLTLPSTAQATSGASC